MQYVCIKCGRKKSTFFFSPQTLITTQGELTFESAHAQKKKKRKKI